jgi:hypothetical protein
MELIVLNIGFDLGVLTPQVFAMMVIMALVTTFMTGPALDLVEYIWPGKKDETEDDRTGYKKFRILFSFGDAERGKSMVRLAHSFVNKSQENTQVAALHLAAPNDVLQNNLKEMERESFKPIRREANKQNLPIQTIFKSSPEFRKEIIESANQGDYDLLIVGMGQSMYEGSFLGRLLGLTSKIINPEKIYKSIIGKENILADNGFDDNTKYIIESTRNALGVFTDKGLKKVDDVVLLLLSDDDGFLISYAQKLIHNNESRVIVIDYNDRIRQNAQAKEQIRAIEQVAPRHIALFGREKLGKLKDMDLMLLSTEAWKELIIEEPDWLKNSPSLLVMKAAQGPVYTT